jgi:Carboxypeptidase regulatory-like domain
MRHLLKFSPVGKFALLSFVALVLCAKPTRAVDLMVNGGFETGALAPWVTQYSGCTDSGFSYVPMGVKTINYNPGFGGTTVPRSGNSFFFCPFTCGPQLATGVYYPANTGFMLLYQDVVVPAGSNLVLSWSERTYTNLSFYPAPDWRSAHPQFYRVEIRNTSNTVLQTVYNFTAPANTLTDIPYTDHVASLGTTYAGQTIRVAFVWTTDTGLTGPGNVGLDRVLLEQLGPTAAPVNVSGYVLTSLGRPPRGALVTLSDLNGNRQTTFVDRQGHYLFTDVEAGQTYFVSVEAKGYSFTPPTRLVTPNFTVENLDFTASGLQ